MFLAPFFAVAGAIAAAVPLVLHLLNRERARQLIFGTIRFIEMSHQTNIRRHRLKRLLLLLLRILMIALLGLAFARPFFAEAPIIAQKTGGKRNALLILDTSYSMHYQQVFQDAKTQARKILGTLDATDAAGLILSSQNAQVVAPLGSEFSHIRAAVDTAEATYELTDYLHSLQTATEILQETPIGEKQIYLIADMQKIGWENFIETDTIPPDIYIQLIDVHPEPSRNLAITALKVPPMILKQQKASQIVARVRNFSDTPTENLPVRLFIDGQNIHTVHLDIESNDLADAVFSVNFQDEATHTGWIELPEDALAADNKRYFTLQSLKAIKVHAVSDKPRTQNYSQHLHGQTPETFFMKMAWTAGKDAVPIEMTESTAVPGNAALQHIDVLVLANVARLSADAAKRVAAYVAAGGGLIITVGERIDTDAYHQQLGGEGALMPCTFVQPTGDAFDRQQFRSLARVRYEHPIFAPFKQPNHGDFAKARFYKIFQAVPTANATVIASYDDGSPALLEKPYGTGGRVLCWTSTIDRDWNDLPIRAVYLPFLHETIKYLALKNTETLPEYHIGDSVELKVSETQADIPPQNREIAVFNPNNVETRLRQNREPATPENSIRWTDTRIPGIYSIHRAAAEAPEVFVVNVDTRESDLAARDVEEIASLLKGTVDEVTQEKPSKELIAQFNQDVERNQNLWIYLMLTVFALAVTEMFLANRV